MIYTIQKLLRSLFSESLDLIDQWINYYYNNKNIYYLNILFYYIFTNLL